MSELTGTLKKIGELQTFSSGFQKLDAVLLTEEQYPQPILIEFLADKSDLLVPYKVGDQVKIHYNIRGREWTSPQGEVKYFNSITGWRVEAAGEQSPSHRVPTATASEAFPEKSNPFAEDEDDDLPF